MAGIQLPCINTRPIRGPELARQPIRGLDTAPGSVMHQPLNWLLIVMSEAHKIITILYTIIFA